MLRSKPIIVTQAILAGLGIAFGGAALADVIGEQAGLLGALLVLSAKVGLDFYVNATTTPTAQVVATQASIGEPVVAGPAATTLATGAMVSPQSRIADVAPSAPSAYTGKYAIHGEHGPELNPPLEDA